MCTSGKVDNSVMKKALLGRGFNAIVGAGSRNRIRMVRCANRGSLSHFIFTAKPLKLIFTGFLNRPKDQISLAPKASQRRA